MTSPARAPISCRLCRPSLRCAAGSTSTAQGRFFREPSRALRTGLRRPPVFSRMGEFDVHRDHLRACEAKAVDDFGVVAAREGELGTQALEVPQFWIVRSSIATSTTSDGGDACPGSRTGRRSSAVRCVEAGASHRRAHRSPRPAPRPRSAGPSCAVASWRDPFSCPVTIPAAARDDANRKHPDPTSGAAIHADRGLRGRFLC